METDLKYSLMTTVAALAVIVIFSLLLRYIDLSLSFLSIAINMAKTKGGQLTAFFMYVTQQTYAKFFATNSQFTRAQKFSRYLGRALR